MQSLFDNFLFPVLTSIVTAGATWFIARRKNDAEARASELDTVEKAVAIWREIAQDLKKELEAQSVEIGKLREEVSTLRRDNARLLSEMKAIQKNQHAAD